MAGALLRTSVGLGGPLLFGPGLEQGRWELSCRVEVQSSGPLPLPLDCLSPPASLSLSLSREAVGLLRLPVGNPMDDKFVFAALCLHGFRVCRELSHGGFMASGVPIFMPMILCNLSLR